MDDLEGVENCFDTNYEIRRHSTITVECKVARPGSWLHLKPQPGLVAYGLGT